MSQLMMTVLLLCSPIAPPDSKTAVIVEEMIAACDANDALIQYGRAKYRIYQRYRHPTGEGGVQERTDQAEILFDGRSARWTVGEQRMAINAEYQIAFDARGLGTDPRKAPPDFVATLYDAGKPRDLPYAFHPRWMGHNRSNYPDGSQTVADSLRAALGSANLTLRIERLPEQIHCEILSRGRKNVAFWLDPKAGYSQVRHNSWVPDNPVIVQPLWETTASYRQVEPGAFVAQRVTQTFRPERAGKQIEESFRECTLLEIDLMNRPDPKTFTLDAIGLPKGARILDKRTGKHYLYGVPAVTEQEVTDKINEMLLEHGGPLKSDSSAPVWKSAWFLGANALVLGCLMGYFGYRRLRRRSG